jgi:hypothetical protein
MSDEATTHGIHPSASSGAGHDSAGHDSAGPVLVEQQPEQLSLLPTSAAPVQFRLDAKTRQLGLVQVAKMRALLAQRMAERQTQPSAGHVQRLRPPVQRDRAA